jgi:hypothetical protein
MVKCMISNYLRNKRLNILKWLYIIMSIYNRYRCRVVQNYHVSMNQVNCCVRQIQPLKQCTSQIQPFVPFSNPMHMIDGVFYPVVKSYGTKFLLAKSLFKYDDNFLSVNGYV